MRTYIYQAALYCETCGKKICDSLRDEKKAPEDELDESSYDSDDFPKGPYADGGGEADTPQHCDACHAFLMNDLTSEGMKYVEEAVFNFLDVGRGDIDVLRQWIKHYEISISIKVGEKEEGLALSRSPKLYAEF